jgi:hypothetical protein
MAKRVFVGGEGQQNLSLMKKTGTANVFVVIENIRCTRFSL